MLERDEIEAVVEQLEEAARARVAMRPPSVLHPGLPLDDAYAIQDAWTARRVAAGRRPVGYKLGLTTPGTQRALGVDRPIYGILFADMAVPNRGDLPLKELIAPRVEPELAFVMRAPLAGECTAAEALEAVELAAPALEIIDNRVIPIDTDTAKPRTALDIVADAGGAAGFVIADRRFNPRNVVLADIEVVLTSADGREMGRFSDVFGSPENALVELARELARHGRALAAGDIVLTGSPLKPASIAAGSKVTADFGALGTIELTAK